MRGAQITGWGFALPDKVVTNADFEARLDTSDEWIVERTGIKQRHHGGTTSGLAVESSRRALERAGRRGEEIDLLVLATTTPDQTVPATSSSVHCKLGCRGAAFDLNAACAGFVYGLVTAVALLDAGTNGHSSSARTPCRRSPTRTTGTLRCSSATEPVPSSSRPPRASR